MNFENGPLAIALAMFTGVIAQAIGRHARIPGIVLLLVAGVSLGPDGADVIRPQAMGTGLPGLVGFAVAIILFEGGFSLQLPVLRTQALPITRLVTVGAVITAVLAAIAALLIMGWDVRLAILFGTLVIVTGPTVVTPLLLRLRISAKLTSILIAEGILIDAVGATIAVVALEVAVAPSRGAAAAGVASIALRFGAGALFGLGGGALVVVLHKVRRLVPHGLENVLVLATVVAVFQSSNAVVHESGITAAIAMGLVVGNSKTRIERDVAQFNEQLTSLFVATLFVLLAADVRLADVEALGWPGAIVAGVLMFVVRPATVFASTHGTDLTRSEKLYLSWIAPRGIVAAAVASLFANELERAGIPGGVEMRALVFVIIASTVTLQGLTAAIVGQLLGVRLPTRTGHLILGANELARLLGDTLTRLGERVTFIERNPETCRVARASGHTVIEGDGLQPALLMEAGIDSKAHAIAMTTNEHVNVLFAQTIANDLRGPELHVALERFVDGVTPDMVERVDGDVMFGVEHDLLAWVDHARRGTLVTSRWRLGEGREGSALAEMPTDEVMLLVRRRGNATSPFTHRTELRANDEVIVATPADARERVKAWLLSRGWSEVP